MLAIEVAYTPGVFHEAPWIQAGRAVEWPPAPIALLASVVDGWMRSGDQDVERLQRLCDCLAELPLYNLPPTTLGHSRHYSSNLKQSNLRFLETSPVLDAFGALSNSEARVSAFAVWRDAQMCADDTLALDRILRAARRLSGTPCAFSVASRLPAEGDRIEVGITSIAAHAGPIVKRLAAHPNLRGVSLFKALLREAISTAQRAPEGFNLLNEAILVDYRFPPQFGLDAQDIVARERARSELPPRIERFALTPLRGCARPCISDTIVVSEAMRWASMRASSARESRAADPVLSGKAPNGEPSEGHRHAFFLPKDLDGDGRIDHLDVWYPTGSSVETHRATVAAGKLYDRRIDGAVCIDYLGPAVGARAIRWRSATPFVLERHVKMVGRGRAQVKSAAPLDQVRASLVNHGTAKPPVEIVIAGNLGLALTPDGKHLSASSFRRSRLREKYAMPAFAVELRFDSIVEGPIVAGKHAHFGLGQFEPMT